MVGWFVPTIWPVPIINRLAVAPFFRCIGPLNENTTMFLRRAVARAP